MQLPSEPQLPSSAPTSSRTGVGELRVLTAVFVVVTGLVIAFAPPPIIKLAWAQSGSCDDPENPCSGPCCSDGMGGEICCDAGDSCCNNGCCADECIEDGQGGEICCPSGQVACNGSCCDGECLDDGSGGKICCPDGQVVCGGVCCDPDECCDTDDDGEGDHCGHLCDSDGDGSEDSCNLCDADGDDHNDTCYVCDHEDANGDPGSDGTFDSCKTCDNNVDGLKEDCKTCDNDGDGNVDDCLRCNTDSDDAYEACYSHDVDGDNVKDSCCPDFRVEMDFTDDFQGRSRSKAGVGETGSLKALDGNGQAVGGATFSTSDDTCVDINATSGAWTAQDDTNSACTAQLCATVNGCKQCKTLTVTPPTGLRLGLSVPGLYHENGAASAGMCLHGWLDPRDVSFTAVGFGEGSCPPTNKEGIYVTKPPPNHAQNGPVPIGGGNSLQGCQIQGVDQAETLRKPWGNGGTYIWDIPLHWIGSDGQRHRFGTVRQQPIIKPDGHTTMHKGTQKKGFAVSEPSVDCP